MPPLRDRSAIRALLEIDRAWSVYALGDLEPGRFEACDWYVPPSETPALVLLYRAFAIPVLFALGEAAAVQTLLDEVVEEPQMYLHVRPEVVSLLRNGYEVHDEKTMWRMILDPARYRVPSSGGVERLGPEDLPALRRLYADGEPTGEAPDFFFPTMLTDGVFFGMHEGGELTAAAGTHLVALAEGVAAVGNIYTRRDRRGRGLAGQATGAVVGELLRRGVRTVALNVHDRNAAALRVYERLGFAFHCAFREGLAVRRARALLSEPGA